MRLKGPRAELTTDLGSLKSALFLEPLSTIDLAQAAVKRAERGVPRFPSDLHHEAIGESDPGLLPKQRDSGGDRFRVLDGQVLVAQQHLDGRCDGLGITTVDRTKH